MMNLLTPFGMFALFGILVIIIIYIIKSRYEEHSVSSTYIWQLSKRFAKGRIPLSSFNRILALILLISMFILLAFILSSPLFMFEGGATEYVLMIDGSCSMQMIDEEGVTRFERAKEKITELTEEMESGSIVHVIYVGDKANEVVTSEDPDEIQFKIRTLNPINARCDEGGAVEIASDFVQKNNDAEVILYTDCDAQIDNVEVVNLAGENDFNVSVLDLTYSEGERGYDFTAKIGSYGKDTVAYLALRLDGRIRGSKEISVSDGEEIDVVINTTTTEFDRATITIEMDENDEVFKDNFPIDDSCEVVRSTEGTKKILVCGTEVFFLQGALTAIGGYEITYTDKYNGEEGYDLYILDRPTEDSYPEDGAIWAFAPEYSVSTSLYNIDEAVNVKDINSGEVAYLTASESKGTASSLIVPALAHADIAVSKIKTIQAKTAADIVFEIASRTAVVAGANEDGLRTLTFAFDIHDSDLPLKIDFIPIIKGSLRYLLPTVADSGKVDVGQQIRLTVLPMCYSMYVEAPSEKMVAYDVNTDYIETIFNEVGTYTITENLKKGTATFTIYSHPEFTEINMQSSWNGIVIERNSGVKAQTDSKIDPSIYIVIGLLAVLLIEWVVHCREQY
ncbi:MAG: VWA domain-containing protein [Clostridia bacterium]|nr:VWA domain-containing protein [Clostridia bacterium]